MIHKIETEKNAPLTVSEQMKLFMEPRSVALVGVTSKVGGKPVSVLEALLSAGFTGRIYPINPSASEILGIKAYPRIEEVPDDIDLAVIITPRSTVPGLVKECSRKGIKAVIVVGQGFADADEEGKALQRELVRIAKENGVRVMGPNTLGVVNPFHRFTSAFGFLPLEHTPVGIICQTGLLIYGFQTVKLAGKGIDLGNTCDVDHADALEYFGQDPEVRVIVIHIEGIQHARRLIEVASRVSREKPILALKTGVSTQGAKAAQSHSSSLTGRDEVYEAAFQKSGIIRVNDTDDLQDGVKTFLTLPPMKGRKIAVAAISGAAGVMAADACEKYGLQLARFSPQTMERIATISPRWLPISNPVDLWPAFMSAGENYMQAFMTIIEALLSDENTDAMLLGAMPCFTSEELAGFAEPVAKMANSFSDKPFVCYSHLTHTHEFASLWEEKGRIVFYSTIERAIRALHRLAQHSEFQRG